MKKAISLVVIAALCLSVFGCAADKTWFEEQGLELTPVGSVTYITTEHNDSGDENEIELTADVSVSESMTEDGYKVVTCEYVCDVSPVSEDYHFTQWQSAFDKYTGTSFEFSGEPASSDTGDMAGDYVFDCNGKDIDVTMAYEVERDDSADTVTVRIMVTCPEDYDGTVFQLGYSDTDINAANAKIDYSAGGHIISELPGYDTNGHDYYYFAFSG